jgi:hypothetical protein
MFERLLQEHFSVVIIIVGCLLLATIVYRGFKFNQIIKTDRAWKKYDPATGNLIEEIHKRPIWDYHIFPGLSKLFHNREWKELFAMILLCVLLFLYLYLKDDKILNLLGINFGVIIGMMIKKSN